MQLAPYYPDTTSLTSVPQKVILCFSASSREAIRAKPKSVTLIRSFAVINRFSPLRSLCIHCGASGHPTTRNTPKRYRPHTRLSRV